MKGLYFPIQTPQKLKRNLPRRLRILNWTQQWCCWPLARWAAANGSLIAVLYSSRAQAARSPPCCCVHRSTAGMSLHVSALRLRLPVVRVGHSLLPSAKPVHLGLARAHSTIPRAPWHLPAPAVGPLVSHTYGADRRSQLVRPAGPIRSLASSQSAVTDPDAASSFSAMTVVSQRIDGVRWRVFGAVPDHAGTPGTKKLRKKLSGPSVLSWYVHVPHSSDSAASPLAFRDS